MEVIPSLEMPLNGREMPPEAFLVLEGPAISNNPMSAVAGMPGMPNMMGQPAMGIPGMGMGPSSAMMQQAAAAQAAAAAAGGAGMMQPAAFPGQPMPQ